MNTFVGFVVVPATELFELFVNVELVGIGGKARLTENHALRFHLGDVADCLDIDCLVEASHKRSLVHDVQLLSCHFLPAKRIAQLYAPIHHAAEEQVELRAVMLHTVHLREEVVLLQSCRLEVHLLHVRRVHTQHTEACVQIFVLVLGCLLNLLACTSDALLANLADVLVTRLTRFALLGRLLGQLHHNILTLTAIFGIELHHGMRRCSGAGEEVEDEGVRGKLCKRY